MLGFVIHLVIATSWVQKRDHSPLLYSLWPENDFESSSIFLKKIINRLGTVIYT
jgi:hypothetical protein